MTIVVSGDDTVLEQVRKQLQKLVPVVKVVDYKDVPFVERDLMLLQVSTTARPPQGQDESSPRDDDELGSRRSRLIELANLFRAKIVDVSRDQLMIELAGTEDKIEAFIQMVRPYGIVELARTGIIAMPRGHHLSRTSPAGATAAGTPLGQTGGSDQLDLPPG